MPRKPRKQPVAKPAPAKGADTTPPIETTEAAPQPAPEPVLESVPNGFAEVENIRPGSVITLHDGSPLFFGEKAIVPVDLANLMRERGQVA